MIKTLAGAAALAVTTLSAAAPAAQAQPYWGYHHPYWGHGPYWGRGPYWAGYGPYGGRPYGYGPYWRPHRCYYGYRCW